MSSIATLMMGIVPADAMYREHDEGRAGDGRPLTPAAAAQQQADLCWPRPSGCSRLREKDGEIGGAR